MVVVSISVVKLANSWYVALNGNVKLTLSSINSTNCTYMWVHLNTSDVHPSRQLLHEQFNNPVKSSRLVVTHSVGRSIKSLDSVDNAGSKLTECDKNPSADVNCFHTRTYQHTEERGTELKHQRTQRKTLMLQSYRKCYAREYFFL